MEEIISNTEWIDKYKSKTISEAEAICYLLDAFGPEKGSSDLNVFSNVLYGPRYLDNWTRYTGCFIAVNRESKEFKLTDILKPGDIDILIIPYDNNSIFYELSAVFEVKMVRPTRNNMRRGANSDGYNQTMGLVNNGFPLVGLIHIITTEPLADHEKKVIGYSADGLNENATWEERMKVEQVKWDWLPFYAESTQMNRLLKYDFPKYVGLKTLTLNFNEDDTYSLGESFDYKPFEVAYLNPKRKKETVNAIKAHHINYKEVYFDVKIKLPKPLY